MWDLFPPLFILPHMTDSEPAISEPTIIGEPPAALVSALRKLLRPLVRLMLTYQISYPFIISLLKSLYVEVAESDFPVDVKRASDSRINLLTGVHRKDVKRLRAETPEKSVLPRTISMGAELVACWSGSKRFVDENGAPRPLPLRTSGNGEEICFDDLVESVCRQDIRPRVILDEWQRLGVATLNDEGFVILNTGAFVPDRGFDEKAFFFGKNIHDHISAGLHNLTGERPACFDRSVYYDKLSAASIEELNQLAEQTGMAALKTINAAALQLQQRDAQGKSQTESGMPQYRMNFGVFNFHSRWVPSVSTQEAASKEVGLMKGSTDV
jgi:hypothetical protein